MKKKSLYLLIALFLIISTCRIFAALQTPYFSEDDAYFTLRQVEHIKDTGLPLYKDPLSYGGREYYFLPLFHYLLAFCSLFAPAVIVLKVVPNILASSLVFPLFLLVKFITKEDKAAILSAFVASLIPVYVIETINSASVHTLTLPLTVFLMYQFSKINTNKKPKWFIITFLALIFTNVSATLLVTAILLYLLFAWTEGLKVKRAEIELALFALVTSVLFYIFFFREALILHGPDIIHGNLPNTLLDNYFSSIKISDTLINIGLIPLLSAIYITFLYFAKRKKKSIYLPMSSAFLIALMLLFKLIPVVTGLIFLSIMCSILFGEFFSYISEYFKKTKFSKLKWTAYLVLFLIIIITSFLPCIYGVKDVFKLPEKEQTATALKTLSEISEKNTAVACIPKEGHMVTYFAKSKNMMDSNYLYINNPDLYYKELKTLYTSAFISRPLEIMEKHNIKYILLNNKTKQKYNISRLSYASKKCMPVAIEYKDTRIYKKNCSLIQNE
ncbi:MAG: hypothetical protein ACQESF_03220 [Nanobdellota archaeon]